MKTISLLFVVLSLFSCSKERIQKSVEAATQQVSNQVSLANKDSIASKFEPVSFHCDVKTDIGFDGFVFMSIDTDTGVFSLMKSNGEESEKIEFSSDDYKIPNEFTLYELAVEDANLYTSEKDTDEDDSDHFIMITEDGHNNAKIEYIKLRDDGEPQKEETLFELVNCKRYF